MDLTFLNTSAEQAARRLLGCTVERTIAGQTVRCRIVETEAYDETDAASHSYKGRTPRTDIMFGQAGYLYVYFTYGMHYCSNIVVGPEGMGAAVLIRAIEPLGDKAMHFLEDRRGKAGVEVTNGPAKLCQALGVDKALNGHDLRKAPFKLIPQPPIAPQDIVVTTRIGIRLARDVPWRFYIRGNPYISKL
jgi:DNA-3-methyladenine glycosylase